MKLELSKVVTIQKSVLSKAKLRFKENKLNMQQNVCYSEEVGSMNLRVR